MTKQEIKLGTIQVKFFCIDAMNVFYLTNFFFHFYGIFLFVGSVTWYVMWKQPFFFFLCFYYLFLFQFFFFRLKEKRHCCKAFVVISKSKLSHLDDNAKYFMWWNWDSCTSHNCVLSWFLLRLRFKYLPNIYACIYFYCFHFFFYFNSIHT